MTAHKDNLISITRAAESLNVSTRTLQRWEKLPNFPQPYRTPGGSRRYSPTQLQEIQNWKQNKTQPPQNVTHHPISQTAQQLNVSPRTLQRWEKLPNFPQPYRTPGGSRRYTSDQINQIKTWHQQQSTTPSPDVSPPPTFTPPPESETPFLPSPYLSSQTPPTPSSQPTKPPSTSKRLPIGQIAIIAALLLLTHWWWYRFLYL